MPAVTLQEVAQRAGVSLATASRVINGSARQPGEDLAERVRVAAVELGYIANAQAQSLARASTGLLGLVVHDIADPYFSMIARGVQDAARGERKVVLLACTGGTPAEEAEAVSTFAQRRADAILVVGSRNTAEDLGEQNDRLAAELRRYTTNGGRAVFIGQSPCSSQTPGRVIAGGLSTLAVPNHDLSERLAHSLADLGHTRFIALAGPRGLSTSDERLEGFQAGLKRAGLEAAEVRRTSFTRNGGYEAGVALASSGRFEAGRRGPCIFAVNDVMAIGAIVALQDAKVSVPGDAFVAGFDDIETLRDFRPALTTVALPLSELGSKAVALALDERPESHDVGGNVVLRLSTELSNR